MPKQGQVGMSELDHTLDEEDWDLINSLNEDELVEMLSDFDHSIEKNEEAVAPPPMSKKVNVIDRLEKKIEKNETAVAPLPTCKKVNTIDRLEKKVTNGVDVIRNERMREKEEQQKKEKEEGSKREHLKAQLPKENGVLRKKQELLDDEDLDVLDGATEEDLVEIAAMLKMNGLLTNGGISTVEATETQNGPSIPRRSTLKPTVPVSRPIAELDEETDLDVVLLMNSLKSDADELYYLCINNQPKLEKQILQEIFVRIGLSQKIRHVSLALTGITDDDVKVLAKYLRHNETIETLNLESNLITVKGIDILMKVVGRHPAMREVKVSNQKHAIGGQGEEYMAKAIENNPSILKFGYSFTNPGARNKADRAILKHNEELRQRKKNGENVYDLKEECKKRDSAKLPWIIYKQRRQMASLLEQEVKKMGHMVGAEEATARGARLPRLRDADSKPLDISSLLSERKSKLKGMGIEQLEKAQNLKTKQQLKDMQDGTPNLQVPVGVGGGGFRDILKKELVAKSEDIAKRQAARLKEDEKASGISESNLVAVRSRDADVTESRLAPCANVTPSEDYAPEPVRSRRRRVVVEEDVDVALDVGSVNAESEGLASRVPSNSECSRSETTDTLICTCGAKRSEINRESTSRQTRSTSETEIAKKYNDLTLSQTPSGLQNSENLPEKSEDRRNKLATNYCESEEGSRRRRRSQREKISERDKSFDDVVNKVEKRDVKPCTEALPINASTPIKNRSSTEEVSGSSIRRRNREDQMSPNVDKQAKEIAAGKFDTIPVSQSLSGGVAATTLECPVEEDTRWREGSRVSESDSSKVCTSPDSSQTNALHPPDEATEKVDGAKLKSRLSKGRVEPSPGARTNDQGTDYLEGGRSDRVNARLNRSAATSVHGRKSEKEKNEAVSSGGDKAEDRQPHDTQAKRESREVATGEITSTERISETEHVKDAVSKTKIDDKELDFGDENKRNNVQVRPFSSKVELPSPRVGFEKPDSLSPGKDISDKGDRRNRFTKTNGRSTTDVDGGGNKDLSIHASQSISSRSRLNVIENVDKTAASAVTSKNGSVQSQDSREEVNATSIKNSTHLVGIASAERGKEVKLIKNSVSETIAGDKALDIVDKNRKNSIQIRLESSKVELPPARVGIEKPDALSPINKISNRDEWRNRFKKTNIASTTDVVVRGNKEATDVSGLASQSLSSRSRLNDVAQNSEKARVIPKNVETEKVSVQPQDMLAKVEPLVKEVSTSSPKDTSNKDRGNEDKPLENSVPKISTGGIELDIDRNNESNVQIRPETLKVELQPGQVAIEKPKLLSSGKEISERGDWRNRFKKTNVESTAGVVGGRNKDAKDFDRSTYKSAGSRSRLDHVSEHGEKTTMAITSKSDEIDIRSSVSQTKVELVSEETSKSSSKEILSKEPGDENKRLENSAPVQATDDKISKVVDVNKRSNTPIRLGSSKIELSLGRVSIEKPGVLSPDKEISDRGAWRNRFKKTNGGSATGVVSGENKVAKDANVHASQAMSSCSRLERVTQNSEKTAMSAITSNDVETEKVSVQSQVIQGKAEPASKETSIIEMPSKERGGGSKQIADSVLDNDKNNEVYVEARLLTAKGELSSDQVVKEKHVSNASDWRARLNKTKVGSVGPVVGGGSKEVKDATRDSSRSIASRSHLDNNTESGKKVTIATVSSGNDGTEKMIAQTHVLSADLNSLSNETSINSAREISIKERSDEVRLTKDSVSESSTDDVDVVDRNNNNTVLTQFSSKVEFPLDKVCNVKLTSIAADKRISDKSDWRTRLNATKVGCATGAVGRAKKEVIDAGRDDTKLIVSRSRPSDGAENGERTVIGAVTGESYDIEKGNLQSQASQGIVESVLKAASIDDMPSQENGKMGKPMVNLVAGKSTNNSKDFPTRLLSSRRELSLDREAKDKPGLDVNVSRAQLLNAEVGSACEVVDQRHKDFQNVVPSAELCSRRNRPNKADLVRSRKQDRSSANASKDVVSNDPAVPDLSDSLQSRLGYPSKESSPCIDGLAPGQQLKQHEDTHTIIREHCLNVAANGSPKSTTETQNASPVLRGIAQISLDIKLISCSDVSIAEESAKQKPFENCNDVDRPITAVVEPASTTASLPSDEETTSTRRRQRLDAKKQESVHTVAVVHAKQNGHVDTATDLQEKSSVGSRIRSRLNRDFESGIVSMTETTDRSKPSNHQSSSADVEISSARQRNDVRPKPSLRERRARFGP